MASTMENISTINSFLRTILATVVLSAASVAGWFGYSTYYKNEISAKKSAEELAAANKELEISKKDLEAKTVEIAQKTVLLQEQQAQISKLSKDLERLETSLALMKVDHRLARLAVTDQGLDPQGQPFSLVEFVELNDEGAPIDTPREFRVRGDLVYIDNFLVKFEDKYVEQADLERGTSLILFHRIFGDKQQPAEGFPLDEKDQRPKAYARAGKMSDLEKKIWGDFWNIANNDQLAHEMGIRAAHGGAVSMKVQKGKSYRVIMRSTGDLSIVPEDKSPMER
ncbi:hypothetical protein [Anatilimnocola floriformis]|uniref:hypothetical protein n=1 Tax=Anatilimnocola floriformis TaxID=2948575 RepID=UPI0020C3C71C|nr:hypothetical protein [Anatilimnocola floriformis]